VTAADHLYAAVARWRRGASPAPRRLRRPVVSVGNLAVGGSGKTPTAAYLYRLLADAGERPAILSRGYARTDAPAGVTVVADGRRLRADLGRAGDEPLLLARGLPGARVLVCEDRYLAGLVAERHLDATVHVLDDGFQHFTLGRDVDLLIVDIADVNRPRTLPGGRLREPLSAAASADALLVTGAESVEVAEAVAARLGVPTVFMLLREVEPPVEETLAGPRPLEPGNRVLVVSGIARPERFLAESRAAGLEVVATLTFRDHHPYTPADIGRIARAAADAKADVVLTTEKDCVRLLPLRPWPFRLAVCPMTVRVEPAEAFATWLLNRLRERASGGVQADGVGAGLQSRPPVIS
jgi:tetraacyldisaccharide 4'-kinase